MRRPTRWFVCALLVGACSTSAPAPGSLDSDGASESSTGAEEQRLLITHSFGRLSLPPAEDNATRCVSWTLDNDQPIYAQSVIVSNEGSFHHSNWFVVPQDEYAGPDGYWTCDDRGYSEFNAGRSGSLLFAQSTQSFVEEQALTDGAVIKIPARSKIVAGIHTLNVAPRDTSTELWLSLEPIHPRDVDAVMSAIGIQYRDLHIPAQTEVRVSAECDFGSAYEVTTGAPIDLKVHYVLPHYHYLGNFFDVSVVGGEMDGQSIYTFAGFDGQANGRTYDPPLTLPGATGLRVTCGFDNWRSEDVSWGNGDGEMCVAMALFEGEAKLGGSVQLGDAVVDVADGIQYRAGPCLTIAEKTKDGGMPTADEIAGDLYLPPVDPGDQGLPPIPECRDADRSAAPEAPVTLESIRETIFAPSCTFSSCHGSTSAAGLSLDVSDLRAELLQHTPTRDAGMPLVTPGDPDRSWLYRMLADCDPALADDSTVTHMPLGSATLLDPGLVAKLRAWIAAGAPA